MKIYSDENEVYDSGQINSDGLTSIRFSLSEVPKFDVIFSIEFNGGSSTISYDITAEGEITFKFENPGLIDFGFSTPVKIGFMDGKELSVIFRVSAHGENTSYTLNYTFYLKVEK